MDLPIRELSKKEFPPLLNEIPDAPKKLFIRGTLPDWTEPNRKFLAVVGARKYTPYGKDACEKIISELRGSPITIISGLALGVDAIAHRVALDAKLPTIAVPGSGLDWNVLYPSSNRRLAENILESGGCLVSEFEPDFRATVWSFPQRNRVMAGMSHAVLIIEAEKKSGTLITSRLATDYNRDVLTVPGSIFSKNSEGPHLLLKLGATPVSSGEDVLNALGFAPDETREGEPSRKYEDCSPDEMKLIGLLSSPMVKDELIRESGMSASQANAVLTMLEIKGLVVETLGEIRLV